MCFFNMFLKGPFFEIATRCKCTCSPLEVQPCELWGDFLIDGSNPAGNSLLYVVCKTNPSVYKVLRMPSDAGLCRIAYSSMVYILNMKCGNFLYAYLITSKHDQDSGVQGVDFIFTDLGYLP